MTLGLLALGGCQLSQSGSSTYGGDVGTGFAINSKRISTSLTGPQPKSITEGDGTRFAIASGKVGKSKAKKANRVKPAKKAGKKIAGRGGRAKGRGGPAKGRRAYDRLIKKHARSNGIPYALARAVVQVESGFRASARGGVGEIGLMQLRARTARGMGYRGSKRGLYNPETNIKYGMRYLGKAYRLGGRSTCGAILKYNAGHGAKRMNPISRRYCNKVRRILRRRS